MAAVSILAVSPAEEDHLLLSHVFSHSNWAFAGARTCSEAASILKRSPVGVVICATELPDGDWKALLAQLATARVPPRLIVASRLADDSLWAEVLDSGGYDVLSMPFEPREVIRVVSLAWRQWRTELADSVAGEGCAPEIAKD